MITVGEIAVGTKFSYQDHEYTRIEDMDIVADSFGNICLVPKKAVIDNAWLQVEPDNTMPEGVIQIKAPDGGMYYAIKVDNRFYMCTTGGNLLYNDMHHPIELLFTQYRLLN